MALAGLLCQKLQSAWHEKRQTSTTSVMVKAVSSCTHCTNSCKCEHPAGHHVCVMSAVLHISNLLHISVQAYSFKLHSDSDLLFVCVALCKQLIADDSVVVQNPVPNAYTLAIGGRKPFIVVHTALLELLEPLEVQVHHAAF